MTTKRLLTGLLTSILLLATAHPASADMGKAVISKHQLGGYLVSVFLSPDPPRAGPVEVSVLLQDARTDKNIIDVPVTIKAFPKGNDSKHLPSSVASAMGQAGGLPHLWQPGWMAGTVPKAPHGIKAKASATTSTNKMLLSAVLDIPDPGRWMFMVEIRPPAGILSSVTFFQEVGEPQPAWMQYTGWVFWPLVAIVVFVIHRTLVRWRQRKLNAQPALAEKDKPSKSGKQRK